MAHFVTEERKHLMQKDDNILAVEDGADLLKGFSHVEAYVSHLVVGHLEDDW